MNFPNYRTGKEITFVLRIYFHIAKQNIKSAFRINNLNK